jgi:hypothetical protein
MRPWETEGAFFWLFQKKNITFEGTLILEATVKKCSLWQQKSVFLAHIHFF